MLYAVPQDPPNFHVAFDRDPNATSRVGWELFNGVSVYGVYPECRVQYFFPIPEGLLLSGIGRGGCRFGEPVVGNVTSSNFSVSLNISRNVDILKCSSHACPRRQTFLSRFRINTSIRVVLVDQIEAQLPNCSRNTCGITLKVSECLYWRILAGILRKEFLVHPETIQQRIQWFRG